MLRPRNSIGGSARESAYVFAVGKIALDCGGSDEGRRGGFAVGALARDRRHPARWNLIRIVRFSAWRLLEAFHQVQVSEGAMKTVDVGFPIGG